MDNFQDLRLEHFTRMDVVEDMNAGGKARVVLRWQDPQTPLLLPHFYADPGLTDWQIRLKAWVHYQTMQELEKENH